MLDVLKPLGHKNIIEKELEGFGIRFKSISIRISFCASVYLFFVCLLVCSDSKHRRSMQILEWMQIWTTRLTEWFTVHWLITFTYVPTIIWGWTSHLPTSSSRRRTRVVSTCRQWCPRYASKLIKIDMNNLLLYFTNFPLYNDLLCPLFSLNLTWTSWKVSSPSTGYITPILSSGKLYT